MKASMHNGRQGSGKHNDRSFLDGMGFITRASKAPHITSWDTPNNLTWRVGHKEWVHGAGGDIEAAERAYYKKAYSAAQEARNARYKAQRHPERCRSTDDLYTGKLTRPEEQILQIGSKDEQVSPEIFRACVKDYIKELNDWNKAHGQHMQILSVSIHFDETTPHAHIRRVWEYDGRDGRALGQDKALEAAGVPLPDPGKAKGRHNNRKMTFDREMRDKWLDICQAHGLQIDREPVPGMRHKNKADFIRDKLAQEIQRDTAARDEVQKDLRDAQKAYDEVRADIGQAAAERRAIRRDIDNEQSCLDALKTSVSLLSAAEVAQIPEGVKTPLWGLLGRDNVLIPRETLDKLIKTAGLAEKASRVAVDLSANKREIERKAKDDAQRLLAQERAKGQREARAIVDQAREEAGGYYELRRELDHYHKLEERYPDHFEDMKQADREWAKAEREHDKWWHEEPER